MQRTAVAIREAQRMNGDVDVIETDVTNNEPSPRVENEYPSPHKQWLADHDMNYNILSSTREENKQDDCYSRVPRATVAISKKCFRM